MCIRDRKSAEYLNYLSSYMNSNPKIQNSGYQTFRDIFSSEYSILDKINYLRGIVNTFNYVYPQLYDIDLRTDYSKINVPIYFFLGRHDINAPISLVENYLNVLEAPHKEIIWFEDVYKRQEQGLDVTRGGAHYNLSGIQMIQVANLADSLAAIKALVYEKKSVTRQALQHALEHNFAQDEMLRQRLVNKVDKYGNDVEWVDSLGAKWASAFRDKLRCCLLYTSRCV